MFPHFNKWAVNLSSESINGKVQSQSSGGLHLSTAQILNHSYDVPCYLPITGCGMRMGAIEGTIKD